MFRKLFSTLLTFFILVLGTFHTAYSQTKDIDGWVLIGPDIELADKFGTIYDNLFLNEQRIERNDDIIILDILMNGSPKGRFKDINTGEMKDKVIKVEYETLDKIVEAASTRQGTDDKIIGPLYGRIFQKK